MNKRAIVLLVVGMGLSLAASPALGMKWWEEEQTGAVQRTAGMDEQGTTYEVVTNWEDGYVQAEAIGTADIRKAVNAAQAKIMAEEAARVRAYAQLAEVVFGFNITSDITVKNGLTERSVQNMRVTGFLNGARVIGEPKTVWLPDGTPMSTVKVGIILARSHPGIGAALPARPERAGTLAEAVGPTVQEVGREEERKMAPRPFVPSVTASPTITYTGLIIDARGLGGSPSLAPRIVAEDGAEVWAFANADPDYAMLYGVVDFAHDMDSARSKARAGDTPMVITAWKVVGPKPDTVFKSDFVISDEDASFLLGANQATRFLEKCAVVIIL